MIAAEAIGTPAAGAARLAPDADADALAVAIEALDGLLATQRDGERGYQACAEVAERVATQSLLLRLADECRAAAHALQRLLMDLGADPDGWRGAPSARAGERPCPPLLDAASTDDALLEACLRGEAHALERCDSALGLALPPAARELLAEQRAELERHRCELDAARRGPGLH